VLNGHGSGGFLLVLVGGRGGVVRLKRKIIPC
jgi:hypothetical protein